MSDDQGYRLENGDMISIVGADKVQAMLAKLPPELQNVAVEAGSNYLLNVLVNREVPPSRSVLEGSRKAAYGQSFFTDRQRRYFFAVVRDSLPYMRRGRNGGVQGEWHIDGSGTQKRLYNPTEGAHWIYSEDQARQLGVEYAGWKKVSQIISEYTPQIIRSCKNAVASYLKKRGLNNG